MSQQSTPPPSFRSDGDVGIQVPDLEKAKAFYGGVMGFRLKEESDRHLAFETGVFTLWVSKDDRVVSYVPAFEVPSFERAKEQLIAAGCTILTEGPRSLWFADPFGIVADVIEKPRA